MAYPVTLTFPASSTTYVALGQTLGAAGNLNLNGTGSDTASLTLGNPRVRLSGFSRPITLTSTGNISGVNFTITGTDIRGAALVEVIAGPNNNTVSTTGLFLTVTSIAANGAVATATSAGIASTGTSQWVKIDYQLTPVSVGLQVAVTGTISWTVEQTMNDVEAAEPPSSAIFAHPDTNMVTQTVSRQGSYSIPYGKGGTHIKVNSSTGGSLIFIVSQAGIV